MISEALNELLRSLAVYIIDNDKPITYKRLSAELRVHVNVAKQILWKFYKKYYKSNDIECTYLLIGLLKDKGMRVEVVKESDVSKAEAKFSKITSKHIYSVHKPLADLQLLASFGSGNVNYSAIKSDACKKRSDEEIQLLRWGAAAKKIVINATSLQCTNSTNPSGTEKKSTTASNDRSNEPRNMTGRLNNREKPSSSSSSFRERDRNSTTNHILRKKKKKDSARNTDSNVKDEASTETTTKGVVAEKENDNTVEKDKTLIRTNKAYAEKTRYSTAKKPPARNKSAKQTSLMDYFFVRKKSPSKSVLS